MEFEISHTGHFNRLDDRAICVTVNTLNGAQKKAKEFKEQGFLNIIIFNADAKKVVEIY
jgi:hypothetical protein